jgi:hypothetical protein
MDTWRDREQIAIRLVIESFVEIEGVACEDPVLEISKSVPYLA